MKILAIRGRNLASLEGDFEIDFTAEPLLSAGIFAISGPTGAGKSTLLDAMCLALFSRTPRTDQAKENNVKLQDVSNEQLSQSDPRFLLRRGTASGFAEVDFMALNGHRYRTRWSVARARDKETGRLQIPRLALYNLDKEEEGDALRPASSYHRTDRLDLRTVYAFRIVGAERFFHVLESRSGRKGGSFGEVDRNRALFRYFPPDI